MDTALVLLVRRAGSVVLADLAAAADAAALHARVHRDTPMAARTLGQQARPTTFGLATAGWCAGLNRAGARLAEVVSELPVQLGGATGACAKVAGDVALLDEVELGEVSEAAPGDASSLPHKRNPIAAWHAEWPALTGLLLAAGGAASRLPTCLEGLQVHPGAKLAHVPPGEQVHHAGDLVDVLVQARDDR